MPIPLLLIVPIIGAGLGAVKGTKGGLDLGKARKLKNNNKNRISFYTEKSEFARQDANKALDNLGKLKIDILDNSIKEFLESFSKLKNLNVKDVDACDKKLVSDKSIPLDNVNDLKILAKDVSEVIATTTIAGAATGFGAYALTEKFAMSGTGVAIKTLSGAAAKNATLAYLGGGPMAAGGLGIAGGTVVFGGLITTPALIVAGKMVESIGKKEISLAKGEAAKIDVYAEEMNSAAMLSLAVRRTAFALYLKLAQLNSKLYLSNVKLKEIIEQQGCDFSQYDNDTKKEVENIISIALTIKLLLDTPVLNEDGSLVTNG